VHTRLALGFFIPTRVLLLEEDDADEDEEGVLYCCCCWGSAHVASLGE